MTVAVALPTGEQLYQELVAEARRRQVGVVRLARQLWPYGPNWKLEQMRIAARPKPATVERIRSVIAGEPVERDFEGAIDEPVLTITRDERAAQGLPPSRRQIYEERSLRRLAEAKAALQRRIALSRLAHERKLPGETLQAATARLEQSLLQNEGANQ